MHTAHCSNLGFGYIVHVHVFSCFSHLCSSSEDLHPSLKNHKPCLGPLHDICSEKHNSESPETAPSLSCLSCKHKGKQVVI